MPTVANATPGANGRGQKAATAAKAKRPSRAKAAVAELDSSGQPTIVVVQGVAVTIPPQLPQTFMMDYAELQEMQINQRPESIGMAAMLAKSVIGDEQWRAVRNALVGQASTDGGAAVLGELLSAILSAGPAEPGE